MTDQTPTHQPVPVRTEGILARLASLRAADAPTHGGRVLSYVYDPDLAGLDLLAAEAMRAAQPVNGLDPTTFTSVAVMEHELLDFARAMLRGGDDVVGSVTSGGTESCLLAVKIARDLFRERRRAAGLPDAVAQVVAPVTVHAAFRKAAAYLDVNLTLIPVDPESGTVDVATLVGALTDDAALVVVSAPSYPHGTLDPVAEVADAAARRGVPVHVDACVGGWILPFWEAAGGGPVPAFDFAVPGVTSISADVHKYGYAPKGASVLLVRGRDVQRLQYFATTDWPGYPVVNATLAGSKSAAPLAAAWAISQALGQEGYTALTARCVRATALLAEAVAGIEGLRVVGHPTGPLLAVATDDAAAPGLRVDPHLWADEVRELGWVLQSQPSLCQEDGSRLPHTAHLTVTPVTAGVVDDLVAALVEGADRVRGLPRPDPGTILGTLVPGTSGTDAEALASLDADRAWDLLRITLLSGDSQGQGLPRRQAPLLALVEALPAPVAEHLLVELIARYTQTDLGAAASATSANAVPSAATTRP